MYRIFCVKILKLNTDTEKYGKICSEEFCTKKENDIWHRRGFLQQYTKEEKKNMDRAQARKKAEALVAKMTIEERAGQLKYDAPAIERLGIPTYNWWNEALHGVARAGTATVFPQAIGCAAMFDEEEMQKIADVIAEEGRAKYNAFSKEEDRDIYKGLTFWSPNINIFRDPRWGRGHETYGEDPFLTARLGVSFIKGLQGDGETMKVAACAKHFAVHSGPEAIRHEFDAVVSQKDLYETYLPAFEAAVKEGGVEAVMGGYNRTNGEPSCGSKTLLKKILREDWGFEGHVVSDCWAIQDFHQFHKVTNGPKESAQMALEAGCDLNCGCTYAYIMAALQDGLVTEEQITEACIRVFTTRFLLGMFDGSEYDDIPYEVVECKEHRNLAVEAAHKGMVLLKNDGILPLDKRKIRTIGVVGPNANNRIALQGNYHGTSSRYVTVLEGIQKEVEDDCRVYYAEGSHMYKDTMENLAWKDDRISEAVITAKQCDVTIVVLGLDELMEGEEPDQSNRGQAGDKASLEFPGCQQRLLEAVTSVGKPVITVVLSGSAMDLRYADAHTNAILQAWYPGAEGGTAVADVLFGRVSPSGKLPVTFYKDTSDLPEFTDYSMKNRTGSVVSVWLWSDLWECEGVSSRICRTAGKRKIGKDPLYGDKYGKMGYRRGRSGLHQRLEVKICSPKSQPVRIPAREGEGGREYRDRTYHRSAGIYHCGRRGKTLCR